MKTLKKFESGGEDPPEPEIASSGAGKTPSPAIKLAMGAATREAAERIGRDYSGRRLATVVRPLVVTGPVRHFVLKLDVPPEWLERAIPLNLDDEEDETCR